MKERQVHNSFTFDREMVFWLFSLGSLLIKKVGRTKNCHQERSKNISAAVFGGIQCKDIKIIIPLLFCKLWVVSGFIGEFCWSNDRKMYDLGA